MPFAGCAPEGRVCYAARPNGLICDAQAVMETWCKICGVREAKHIDTVADAGGNAIGLVFAARSKRRVALDEARSLAQHAARRGVSSVGMFADPQQGDVAAVLDAVGVDLLQFHGAETAEFCEQFAMPYIKVLPVANTYTFPYTTLCRSRKSVV